MRHWSEVIGEVVIKEKKSPLTIASAITPSGPTHMGTLCEFLYPSALEKYFEDEGYRTRFIFIGDILDAFDNIPEPLSKYRSLEKYLGQPLCHVPDPFGCCPSYGDHFLDQIRKVMKKLEVHPKIIPVVELYNEGKYDDYVRLFIQRLPEIAKLLEDVSKRKIPQGWKDIVLPICENCGKIATTTVTGFDGDTVLYSDDKDVKYTKGCGYKGETKLGDHRYKVQWRLDWPSRQSFLNVSVEGAGVDHHTRGGSWDTAVAIHTKIFRKNPPVGFKYGFLLFHGKKYSKSKGLGIGVQELLDLIPPSIVKYFLFKPDIEENKDFDPSGYNLIKLYDEYNGVADLSAKNIRLTRAESKVVLAYRLATEKRKWKVDFTDLLINYQILHDWKAVAGKLGDSSGILYLKRYVENWIKYGYIPKEFVFDFAPKKVETLNPEILQFAKRLDESMSALEVHNLVYKVAQLNKLEPTRLFKVLYRSLIDKDYGPRFGKLATALTVSKVKKCLLSLYAT